MGHKGAVWGVALDDSGLLAATGLPALKLSSMFALRLPFRLILDIASSSWPHGFISCRCKLDHV